MPPKNILWKLYYSNKSKYLTNQSHCNAWCLGCLHVMKQKFCNADIIALAMGEITVGRSEEAIMVLGKSQL